MDESASLPIWEDIVAPNPQQPPSSAYLSRWASVRVFGRQDFHRFKSGKTRTVPRPLDWYLV